MTSRRPMTRSYSGNGRTSSFSEDESSSSNGRSESRNTYLSNVRPENRSTLCSVMAQLTEDIQPSFETTLKSKAVSENCNVKFTCVVTGYPAPELKWYKDDMEMDRYCGLPKYEIRRNGKNHTLHIYNCTLDDAAIYQVSASNSKGIVSCSGVLEVGTMSEYKIHQRFFAKLKQKAEKKKKDLEEHTKKEGKENIQKEPQSGSEHPQRKRTVAPAEENQVAKKPLIVDNSGEAGELNGISTSVTETDSLTTTSSLSEKEVSSSQETLAKKRIKMTNSGASEVATNGNSSNGSSKSHIMGNGGENSYDGGLSLAQFLAETLQSQIAEEKQASPQEEIPKETDTAAVGDVKLKDKEGTCKNVEEMEKALHERCEKEQRQEVEVPMEREKERQMEKQMEKLHATKTHGAQSSETKHPAKGHKDHDHLNIQASISSMIHTVKGFLFGKNKKDAPDLIENEDNYSEPSHHKTQPSQVSTQFSFQLDTENTLEQHKQITEDVVPMDIDKTEEQTENIDNELSKPLEPLKDTLLNAPELKFPPKSTEDSKVVKEDIPVHMDTTKEPQELESHSSAEDKSLSGLQVHTPVEEKFSDIAPAIQEVQTKRENSNQLVDLQPSHSPSDKYLVSRVEDECVMLQAHAHDERSLTPTFNKLESCSTLPRTAISPTETSNLEETLSMKIIVEKGSKEKEPKTGEDYSTNELCEKEKAEVKFSTQPFNDINRSEVPKLSSSTLEDRTELSESKSSDQVLSSSSAVEACGVKTGHVKEDTKSIFPTQETNVGFPPTTLTEGLEDGDLKMQHTCKLSEGGEITEPLTDKVMQRSNLGFQTEEGWLKERSHSDLEKNLCNILKTQQQASGELESSERNESLLHVSANIEELNKQPELKSNENSDYEMEKGSILLQDITHSSENISSIQISTEGISGVKPSVTNLSTNKPFIIPQIEILEPELKESTLPLTILAHNHQESTNLQKHNVTLGSKIRIRDDSMTESADLLPTYKEMQGLNEISSKENGNKVSEEKLKQQLAQVQYSKQFLQLDNASIPIINISCSDDKKGDTFIGSNDSCPQQTETSMEPIFVVPPISVTCHESSPDIKSPIQTEKMESETLAGTQRGTEKGGDRNMTTNVENTIISEDFEEKPKENIKENTSTLINEDPKPKIIDSVPTVSKSNENTAVPDTLKPKPLKDAKIENLTSIEDFLKSRPSVERLCSKPPTYPSLSPASLRKFMSKAHPDSDNENSPGIFAGDRQSDKADDDLSGGSTPTSSLSCESSPRMKRRDSLTLIRSATPEELASGARRKIFIPKCKEDIEGTMIGVLEGKKETPYMSPSQARRAALLQASSGQNTPPMERRSPLLSRRKATLEVPKVMEETPGEPTNTNKEEKSAEKKADPLKAPQVIRKIRGEPFPDASGHLKLWCQFFNVLIDSTIKWYKDEEEILEVKKSGGDESQVALAIVLASNQDCGVYGCTITNEYGTETTDYLLSTDILSEILLKDELEAIGEEIEMTPLLFAKGLADYGSWGEKYFGRIFTDTQHMGEGCNHKTSRVKVIYGLDPIFESGSTCIIKVQNPIAFGTKQDSNLAERNLDITKQECKVQNMIREYCKIFAAEGRVIENFGFSLEVIPQYLMYRPAKSIPYATVETDIKGEFIKYCTMDAKGKLSAQNVSEVEQKCCTFQHWIHQWTHGNLLVTQLQGVETKITNIKVVTKSKGYQGLTECGSPEVFDQFLTLHQCNYYCGLLGLRPLKSSESQQQPTRIKGSRSPLLSRKLGSNSPTSQRKGQSPQLSRKGTSSPKVVKKVKETEESQSGDKPKSPESLSVLEIR